MTLTQTNRNPKVCASSHVAGGHTKGWSLRVLVCSVFSDLGTRRQHQPQQPGVSTGDPPGGCRHIQPTRWVALSPLRHFDARCELNDKTFFLPLQRRVWKRGTWHSAACSATPWLCWMEWESLRARRLPLMSTPGWIGRGEAFQFCLSSLLAPAALRQYGTWLALWRHASQHTLTMVSM